jgi:hypothetical protein
MKALRERSVTDFRRVQTGERTGCCRGRELNYLKIKGAVVNIPGLDKGGEEWMQALSAKESHKSGFLLKFHLSDTA